ncbi:MAG: DUF134 domain-containing protein [Opitutaceae bacterium]|nr:DUF134 domain-containing protein [Opitutaceae bacterium]
MPRPPCPRRITHRPPADYFKPAGIPLCDLQEIELAADELEAVRLADDEDLYNTEAAQRMGVSRQTFDRIVGRARRKIAAALVHGQALRILRQQPGRLAGRRADAGTTSLLRR